MTVREWARSSTAVRLAAIWGFMGFLGALFERLLWEVLFIFLLSAHAAYAAVWGVLLLVVAVEGVRVARTPRGLVPAGILVLLAGVLYLSFWPLARLGSSAVTWLRFEMHRDEYERIVASVRSTPPLDTVGEGWITAEARGVEYVVDLGPPVRVAFVQPGGFLDNWEGIVYDPSGAVTSARGWRDRVPGDYTADGNLVGLFGGSLVECTRLEGHFYRCSFT